jgi:phosphatidate cytidylyltransferase
MLSTRLWMGTCMIALTIGMLVVDQWLAPWYPFLLVFVIALALLACRELIGLLGRERSVQVPIVYAGVLLLVSSSWWMEVPAFYYFQERVLILWIALVLVAFFWEMAVYTPQDNTSPSANGPLERMARTLWAIAYLGLLPCFLVHVRWLYPAALFGSVALALIIFVPKACDVGAYCTGRLLGRHPMTPVLSPKKTWEGAAGGIFLGVLAAIGINRITHGTVLGGLGTEIAFGVTLSIVGMCGDLAESLVKRACSRKDASAAVPGFGGVLDVVDSVLFAAPVGYLWLENSR